MEGIPRCLGDDDLPLGAHRHRSPQVLAHRGRRHTRPADLLILMDEGIDSDPVEFCQPVAFFNVGDRFALLPLGVGLARDADDLRHLLLRHAAEVSQERQILCQHIDHLLVCAIIIQHTKESFHHTNLSEKCFLCSFCLRDHAV